MMTQSMIDWLVKKWERLDKIRNNDIPSIQNIISCGFDLVESIKNANWSYNNKVGLNTPTDHMRSACERWQYLMEDLNKSLNGKKEKQ